ncbi:hypothetical protein KY331_04065 [Candidatus Woesearchaeota archaeon]|nr:hypothetical protein [Candidatus Woesearchaeota archaeon]
MKIIKLFLIILTFFALLNSVSATRYVDYEFKEGIVSNGQLNATNNSLTNVSVIGFVCSNADCSNVTDVLWNGSVLNSGTNSSIQLEYPTTLQSSHGYGVYYFKDGYIPWEQNPNWWGTSSNDPQGPYERVLSKKDICAAQIDSFIIANNVQPNIPLVINVEASLDASAHAAIQHAGPLTYVPPQLEDHYSVKTAINLKVYDWLNNVVEEQTKIVNVTYGGTARVEFSWTPIVVGNYRAVASTSVVDGKCIDTSDVRSTSKDFHVLAEDPKNICYTLLNNLHVSDYFPLENETITISINKISNYADGNYVLSAVPTSLSWNVFNSNGLVVYGNTVVLPSNSNTSNSEAFDFNYTVGSAGKYSIVIEGIAQSSMCSGLTNLPEAIRVDINVRSNGSLNQPPVLAGLPDLTINENEVPPVNWTDLWQYTSDAESNDTELQFRIVSQSNSGLIDCRIDDDRYINCILSADSYGFSDITVEVSDGEYSDRDSFRINVNETADRPIISNFPNVNFGEDGSAILDLNLYVNDPNNNASELSWSVSGNYHVHISIDSNNIATFTADTEWSGVETVVFTVRDPDGNSDSDSCIVSVGALNDGPVLDEIDDVYLEVEEETKIDLNDYVTDNDNSDSELSWSYRASRNVEVSIDQNNIATIKSKTRLGKFSVTFTVEDPNGLVASNTFYVHVSYEQESSDLVLDTVRVFNEFLRPGEDLIIDVGLRNNGYMDFDGLKVTVLVYDLGIGHIVTSFDLDDKDSVYERLCLFIPDDTPRGIYDVRIVVSNDDVRRVINREFFVI